MKEEIEDGEEKELRKFGPPLADRMRTSRSCMGSLPDLKINDSSDRDKLENQSVLLHDQFMNKCNMHVDHDQQSTNVDLNSHVDIFYAIHKQVSESGQCDQLFLNVLQHLVQLDTEEYIWNVVERLVHRGSLVEDPTQADQLLLRLHHLNSKTSTSIRPVAPLAAPPPAPPLPVPGTAAPPPAPPLHLHNGQRLSFAEQLELKSQSLQNPTQCSSSTSSQCSASAYSRAPSSLSSNSSVCSFSKPGHFSSHGPQHEQVTLPQQRVPKSTAKLKSFAWNKVPVTRVLGGSKKNIWAQFNPEDHQLDINFARIDDWFSLDRCQNGPVLDSAVSSGRLKKVEEVHLLAPKRSLNVNIFLKQFRKGVPELLELIVHCNNEMLGLEKLRGLAKILPQADEMETLKGYTGSVDVLGSAEQFFLQLLPIPHYRIRVESMLLKEEFASLTQYIKPALDALILAGQDIIKNKDLHEILYLTLMIGNYLNAGSYGGNAAGFKVSSLAKLIDVRAPNKSNLTLMHLVAMEAEKKSSLLHFSDGLKFVEGASKLSVETVRSDVCHLRERTNAVEQQLNGCTDFSLLNTMHSFMITAKDELQVMEGELRELEKLRHDVAEFFCEDAASFKLEDCCRIFHHFSVRFKKAIEENVERQRREENGRCGARRKRSASMDGLNKLGSCPSSSTQYLNRTGRGKGTEQSPLSEKYQALCSSRDITLTTYINANDVPPDNSPQRQLRKTGSTSGDLLHFLEKSTSGSSYSCGSITNRSGKRKTKADSRDRQSSWTQRVEQLLQDDEEVQQLSTGVHNLSIDKPRTQQPVFARTRTALKDTARINAIDEHNELNDVTGINDTPKPRTWIIKKSERAKKSQSLVGSSAGEGSDLGQLLDQHLEVEQQIIGVRRKTSSSSSSRTNIDELVRVCEKSKEEIDRIGFDNPDSTNRDSGIVEEEYDTCATFTYSTSDQETAGQFHDVYIDMTLPDVAVSRVVPLTVSSDDGESPHKDEGFETESHSTVCSNERLNITTECTPRKSGRSSITSTPRQLNRSVSNKAPVRQTSSNSTTPTPSSAVPRNNLVRKFVGRISSPQSKNTDAKSTPAPANRSSVPASRTTPTKKTTPLSAPSTTRSTVPPTRPTAPRSAPARTSKVTPKPDPKSRPLNSRMLRTTSAMKAVDSESTSSADSPPQMRRKPETRKPMMPRLTANKSQTPNVPKALITKVPLSHPIKNVATERKPSEPVKKTPNKNVWDRLTKAETTATATEKRSSPVKSPAKSATSKPISAFGGSSPRRTSSPVTKAWK